MNQIFFVLKTHRYSEADLFINGLDQNGAKIRMIARAALKSKKRFGGGLFESTHLVEARLSDTERDGVRTVLEARLIDGFEPIRKSYEKLQYALKVIAVMDKWGLEGVTDHKPVYDLLGHTLKKLIQMESCDRVYVHFGVRLCHFMGLLPEDQIFAAMVQVPMAFHEKLGEFECQPITNRLASVELPSSLF